MTGYVRQSAADIVADADIDAGPLNDEFNALQAAFESDGHNHSGSSGNGPKIPLTSSVSGILPVANGGTNASTASDARTSLGLGTIATQAASAVAITGGDITGITDLAVADGGTGASTAANARTNLGLDTMATQAASAVAITGGTIAGITDLAVADGGTGASTAAGARSNLDVYSTSEAAALFSGGGKPSAVLSKVYTASDASVEVSDYNDWETHPLDTEDYDPDSVISISGNQFTPTEDGWVEWDMKMFGVWINTDANYYVLVSRLYNVTGGSEVSVGSTDIQSNPGIAIGGSQIKSLSSSGGGAVTSGSAYRIEFFAYRLDDDGGSAEALYHWWKQNIQTGAQPQYHTIATAAVKALRIKYWSD